MLRLFQDSFIFEEATSSYFFRVITLTQQLLFRSSYFFRSSTFFDELLFQNSHFFAGVIFSEQLLFQSETPTEPPLENRKFFRVVTFWNSYLSGGGIQKRYFFEAGTQHQMFQKSYISKKNEFFRKAISRIIHFFLESYLFRPATFSKDVIFSSSYLFRRDMFLQHAFSEKLPFQYQLRTAKVWEFFLVYLLLLKVASSINFI